jgi:hypothetical protein
VLIGFFQTLDKWGFRGAERWQSYVTTALLGISLPGSGISYAGLIIFFAATQECTLVYKIIYSAADEKPGGRDISLKRMVGPSRRF